MLKLLVGLFWGFGHEPTGRGWLRTLESAPALSSAAPP